MTNSQKLEKLKIQRIEATHKLYKYIDKMIDKNYVWAVVSAAGWLLALALFLKGR